jgi:hypothetical protein
MPMVWLTVAAGLSILGTVIPWDFTSSGMDERKNKTTVNFFIRCNFSVLPNLLFLIKNLVTVFRLHPGHYKRKWKGFMLIPYLDFGFFHAGLCLMIFAKTGQSCVCAPGR